MVLGASVTGITVDGAVLETPVVGFSPVFGASVVET